MGKSNRNYSHQKPDNFVVILYRILEGGKYWCLHWNEDGTEVVIERPETVASEVLPRYFGTKKYQSFTRQFHLYGFRRVTDGRKERTLKGHCRFRHPEFLRDHPHLLDKIARVKVPRNPSAQHDIMSSGLLANDETMRINPFASTQAVTLPPIQLSSENIQDEDDKMVLHQQISQLPESPHVFPQAVQMVEKESSPMEPEVSNGSEYHTPQAKQAVSALQSLEDVIEELEPTVLAFVRGQLEIVSEAITKALSTNNGGPLSPPSSKCGSTALASSSSSKSSVVGHGIPSNTSGFHVPALTRPSFLPRNVSALYPSQTQMLSQPVVSSEQVRRKFQEFSLPQINTGLISAAPMATNTPPDSMRRITVSGGSPSMSFSGESSPYVSMAPMASAPITTTAGLDGFTLAYPGSAHSAHMSALSSPFYLTPNASFVNNCNPLSNEAAVAAAASLQISAAAAAAAVWTTGEQPMGSPDEASMVGGNGTGTGIVPNGMYMQN